MVEEKSRDLNKVLSEINKTLGLNISKLKDMDAIKVNVVPSGSYTVDDALGVGGYPKGRIIEIYGKPSGGKTLLSLLAIAETQKMGELAAFVDVEHAFDPTWAKKLGVDVDNLYFTQPDHGEQALTAVEELVKTGKFGIIVIDSTAALIPKAELEADLESQQIALQARMMSKALRRMMEPIGKSQTVVIFINQVRTNPMQMFGDPETTPGGEALKFYSSIRLSVNKKSSSEIKEGEKILGHKIKISVKKNKVAPPFRQAELTLKYDTGVDRIDELVTMALDREIVELKGPTYVFKDKKWMGRPKFQEELTQDKNLQEEIWEAIKNKK
jgi:recombination protein RecA